MDLAAVVVCKCHACTQASPEIVGRCSMCALLVTFVSFVQSRHVWLVTAVTNFAGSQV